VYWLDYAGGVRRSRGNVYANDSVEYYTFVRDPFVVAECATGEALAVFVPTAESPCQAAVVKERTQMNFVVK
jgi:hypothetical protein